MKKIATEGLNNPPQPGTPTTIPEFADNKNVANQATMHRMDGDLQASSSSVAAAATAPASSVAAADHKGKTGKGGTGKGKRRNTSAGKGQRPSTGKGGQRRNTDAGKGQQRRRGARQSTLPEHHSGSGNPTRRSFQDINQRIRGQQNAQGQRRAVVLKPARSRSPRFIDQSEL